MNALSARVVQVANRRDRHRHRGRRRGLRGRWLRFRYGHRQARRLAADPASPAPPLQLQNYQGQEDDLDQFRGKAVLVTFVSTHCPDGCPAIIGKLRAAQSELGSEASNLQVIAVSIDPTGDTPRMVKAFLKDRQMTGSVQWLIGSRAQLGRTWKAWGIATRVPSTNRELVERSAEIFGIDASGTVRTLYPGNFKPKQIVHDVPILASE